MNFEGHSINELSTDPAIIADIAQLKKDVIVLARTDAFCSIEAVAPPPTLTYQPSYEIEQSVQLLSNDPALYNQGYVQSGVAGVVLEYTEIGGVVKAGERSILFRICRWHLLDIVRGRQKTTYCSFSCHWMRNVQFARLACRSRTEI